MLKTLGNDCPSLSTVRKWEFLFKRGRLSVEDDPRAGAPKCATNDENIDAVHSIVMNDRRVTITHIAETLSISSASIWRILSTELHMKKLSARWVPRMLTADQMRTRVQVSKQLLARLTADRETFFPE